MNIKLEDSIGNEIANSNVTEIKLKEKAIRDKSIELFDDEEPCIIHKTYVMKKIYIEIVSYFENIIKDENTKEVSVLWDSIPEYYRNVMEIEDAYMVKILHEWFVDM